MAPPRARRVLAGTGAAGQEVRHDHRRHRPRASTPEGQCTPAAPNDSPRTTARSTARPGACARRRRGCRRTVAGHPKPWLVT